MAAIEAVLSVAAAPAAVAQVDPAEEDREALVEEVREVPVVREAQAVRADPEADLAVAESESRALCK